MSQAFDVLQQHQMAGTQPASSTAQPDGLLTTAAKAQNPAIKQAPMAADSTEELAHQLAFAASSEQKQIIGEKLYSLIIEMHPCRLFYFINLKFRLGWNKTLARMYFSACSARRQDHRHATRVGQHRASAYAWGASSDARQNDRGVRHAPAAPDGSTNPRNDPFA